MFLFEGCGANRTGASIDKNATVKEVYLEPSLKKYGLKLLIPMYIYPSPKSIEWRKLIDFKKVYPDSNITTIVNPDNGHFTKLDSNYKQIIQKLVDANITVLGYVHTNYGERDIDDVTSDIDAWKQFYGDLGVDGIFFDEAATDNKHLEYYTKLSKYTREKGFARVVLNPGTGVDDGYIKAGIANIIVDYEDIYAHLSNVATWNTPTKSTSLAMLVYDVNDTKVQEVVKKAVDNNISYIYLTNISKHPYTGLSKYLSLRQAFSKKEFQETLKISKLQAPTSSYDPMWGTHYGEFNGVANRYFYLNDNLVHFAMCGYKRRSELRFKETWNVSTKTPKTMEAKLEVYPLDDQISEFTFLQIHTDSHQEGGINSPLLRIVWKKVYNYESDHLWAIVKLDTIEDGDNYEEIDLGKRPDKLFTVKISVKDNKLYLWINQQQKIDNMDVSYWNEYLNYFKAGVYLQSEGCAKSSFDTLRVY